VGNSDSQSHHFCAQSDVLFHEFRVELRLLNKKKQALRQHQRSRSCRPRAFCRCRTSSTEHVVLIFRNSRSTVERDHCLRWKWNKLIFFSTITLILSENFYQNFVLISENHRCFLCPQKKKRQRYCRKLTDWIGWHTENFGFPILLKYLNLKSYSTHFVQNCKVYSKEMLVYQISGKINSDKFSRSYDDE